MSMRKLNAHTILQLWCCCHVIYKLLYPSIRVRTAPSVSVRVRVSVSVSFSFVVMPLRILICMCPIIFPNIQSNTSFCYLLCKIIKSSSWSCALLTLIHACFVRALVSFWSFLSVMFGTTHKLAQHVCRRFVFSVIVACCVFNVLQSYCTRYSYRLDVCPSIHLSVHHTGIVSKRTQTIVKLSSLPGSPWF